MTRDGVERSINFEQRGKYTGCLNGSSHFIDKIVSSQMRKLFMTSFVSIGNLCNPRYWTRVTY